MPRKTKTTSSGPLCLVCGASDNTPFGCFPQVEGYSFGEICCDCEEAKMNEAEAEQEAREALTDANDRIAKLPTPRT